MGWTNRHEPYLHWVVYIAGDRDIGFCRWNETDVRVVNEPVEPGDRDIVMSHFGFGRMCGSGGVSKLSSG